MTREEADRFVASEADLEAWSIIFAEMEGQRFDWDKMRFVDPPKPR